MTRSFRTISIPSKAATARAINEEIQYQRNRLRDGPAVALADGTRAFTGDQLATRRNDPSVVTDQGHSVKNRHTWTVTAVHRDGSLTVATPTAAPSYFPPPTCPNTSNSDGPSPVTAAKGSLQTELSASSSPQAAGRASTSA